MTLSIPAPCAQRWADMTPLRTDCRHCAACERQITDFSTKTDAEILAHLRSSGGKVCGRFRPDQLGRPLVAARSNLRRGGLTAAAASVAALLMAQVPAQAQPQQAEPTALAPKKGRKVDKLALQQQKVVQDSVRIISGKVVNAETGKPLRGGLIAVKSTASTASIDENGLFSLRLPLDFVRHSRRKITLEVAGYKPLRIRLPAQARDEDLAISPIQVYKDPDLMIMGCPQF